MIDRAGSPSAGTPIASSASRQAAGPGSAVDADRVGARRGRAIAAATAGLLPSASTSSSPNVSEAMTGTSDARRASSTASSELLQVREGLEDDQVGAALEQAVDLLAEGGPRARRPRSAGPPRVGDPSGPTEPPTSASRPLTSRASRASWAARRLSRPTSPSRPQAARRRRFAPNDSVSISSAPASRYSRWAAPTISGWVVDELLEAGSLRHAPAEQQRPQPAVDQQRARGEAAPEALSRRADGRGSVIGPLRMRTVGRRDRIWQDPSCSEGSRGSSLIAQEDLPGLGTLPARCR